MPDANNNHPLEYNGWAMRVRHASKKPARLMLMLHGWTGDENSMWVFTRNLPQDLFILAPRAPHAIREGGYSWRAPQPAGKGLPALLDLKPAAVSLLKLVDELSVSIGVNAASFDLVGFSQGGAMANCLALLFPERIHRAAVLAGFMPGGVDDLLESQVLKGIPFFVAHGTRDQLVPVESARESIGFLERAGAQVTFCEAEVGHKVSADCLRALEAFFSAA